MTSERAPFVEVATGAYVREHFLSLLAEAVSAAHREGAPLCLLYVDLDETAVLGSEQGQQAVEETLTEVASAISQGVDGLGPIGRLEDDAFGVLLTGCPPEQAQRVAQAVRRAVAGRHAEGVEGRFSFTASVGLACLRPAEPWGNLLDAAEEACTRAKQGGRNGVVAR